jgi:hypothetical protein
MVIKEVVAAGMMIIGVRDPVRQNFKDSKYIIRRRNGTFFTKNEKF